MSAFFFIEFDDLIERSRRYLMSLLGINVSVNNTASTAPSVTLTPYQFENAVSQIAAQLIWIGVLFRIFHEFY